VETSNPVRPKVRFTIAVMVFTVPPKYYKRGAMPSLIGKPGSSVRSAFYRNTSHKARLRARDVPCDTTLIVSLVMTAQRAVKLSRAQAAVLERIGLNYRGKGRCGPVFPPTPYHRERTGRRARRAFRRGSLYGVYWCARKERLSSQFSMLLCACFMMAPSLMRFPAKMTLSGRE